MPLRWEDAVSRNSMDSAPFTTMGNAAEAFGSVDNPLLAAAIMRDPYPIPTAEDREQYFIGQDAKYWLSGYLDSREVMKTIGGAPRRLLDLGCASGRLLRHLALGWDTEVWGCDINYRHVRWINQHLPPSCRAVQITALPHLPFADGEFDAVVALSVFTHQESLDTAWIAEIRRVLAPGGTAYLTVHTEHTWAALKPEQVLYKHLASHPGFTAKALTEPMQGDKLVFRFGEQECYKAHVFHHTRYMQRAWDSILPLEEIQQRFPDGQDVAVFRKPSILW